MFSGAKNKLQQWRQRKTPAKIIEIIPREGIQKKANKVSEHLQNLQSECDTVIGQLNQQVDVLSEIDEDTTVVAEKIKLLQDHVKTIDKGLRESEAFATFLECIDTLHTAIKQGNTEIEDLHRQATSLFNENRKLRTELQIFQDHHERSELRVVELQVQEEHLKFMSSLPSDYISEQAFLKSLSYYFWSRFCYTQHTESVDTEFRTEPFFEGDEKGEVKEDEEKFAIKPKVAIPFLEDEDPIENAGSYILSVLDTLDFTANSRLKILFDLIKSYIQEQAYDIAIPLLKTTIEDLVSKYDRREKVVFIMMEVMVIVYKVTQRFADAIEIEKEILEIRKDSMPEDIIGLAQTLSSLALLYGKTGKIKTARNYCRQALDLKNQVYGERNLETAKELHNMGVLYSYDEKYSKAIDCLITAINLIRTCSKRSVFCLATAAANLASVHIQNEEFVHAKRLFNSTLKFLNKELDKTLEGKNISKSEILDDASKIDELTDCDRKRGIQRIVHLLREITEKASCVSHVEIEVSNQEDEKYNKVNISDED